MQLPLPGARRRTEVVIERMSAKAFTTINAVRSSLRRVASPSKAKLLARFFKTGKGEYGEGDKFLGITVPESRAIAHKFSHLPLSDITKLLRLSFHEERLVALLILVHRFEKGNPEEQVSVANFYLASTKYINNWDLVDLSAHKILGPYLTNRPKRLLQRLAMSENIWERRIAVLTTFEFIRQHRYTETLKLARVLLKDKHDLMHKAVGWMLREVGKRNRAVLEKFLAQNYHKMPRTMLRYAIERLPGKRRQAYLKGVV